MNTATIPDINEVIDSSSYFINLPEFQTWLETGDNWKEYRRGQSSEWLSGISLLEERLVLLGLCEQQNIEGVFEFFGSLEDCF